MEIEIKVITRAKMNKVEKVDDVYVVRTSAVPDSGKANAAVQKLLAKYFEVGRSKVELIKGEKSRLKKFRIEK